MTLLLPLVALSPASGDQVADKKAEAAQIAKELDADGSRVSMAAEQFDRAQLKLQDVRASLDKAKADLARADDRMKAARYLLAQSAVQSYVTGGSANLFAHLAHSDSSDLVVRSQYLRVTAADQQDVIGQVKAAKQDFTALQSQLTAEERDAASAAASADTARQQASDADAAQRALLGTVNGELSDLVAAESANRQAAQLTAAPVAGPAAPVAGPAAAAAGPRPAATSGTRATNPAPAASPSRPAAPISAPPSSGGAGAAVAEAQRQLGKPYVYGAAGPDSFDCSGLTMWAWSHAGVSMSHSAEAQYGEFPHVSTDSLQPGDLVFYG
ncbi:MAG: NlpC/P60 family protein, partial [Acidimicrobiales bacterium]